MSRRVTLYIGGERADLSEASPILWNWTREELDNPTIVRNSYTHQLTLPGTPANDAIFGAFQRVDRAYTAVVGQTTGIAFNPLKKASFALYDERSEVLARGYLKLDGIESRGEQAHGYKVTLYGGLGSLFFDLDATADGEKRTLADLIYKDADDADLEPTEEALPVTWRTLGSLWDSSWLGGPPSWHNVLTFAPCYNGLPDGDFDANKAVVLYSSCYNFPEPVSDGGSWTPLGGTGETMLATFANKHTEWEMRDLRCYLQRPVVSVKAVLDALCDQRNTGDWTLALDGSFFQAGNPWWEDAWLTLPLLKLGEGQSWDTDLTIADALRGSCTPAAFLIGYAKTFGLVFDVDEAAMTVTLMARDDYYASAQTVDLTERMDRRDVQIVPVNASARWYEMKADTVGEYAKTYADTYGRVYGSQRIDTGWEFDASVRELLQSYPFRGGADVLETSALFYHNYHSAKMGMAAVDQEAVKYQLYDGSGNAKDFDAYIGQYLSKTVTWYNAGHHGSDAWPKVQLHSADNKAEDGSGVLLIYTGDEALPVMDWRVSGDTQDMYDLNGGRPCWLIGNDSGTDSYTPSTLPSFRRMAGALTMDFGAPREIAVPDETTGEGATIYYNRWRGYLADRLDVDTKVLTAKVDLRGMRVGPALLRDLYWWRNALWSLNRIKDYAPTVGGLTECEFVQVQDADAYGASQAVPALEQYYLNVSPGSLSFIGAGESKTFDVTANVSWTLSVPAWITASTASGSGNATVTLTASENTGSSRTGTVALTGGHSTSASVSLSQATSFVPSISITPVSKSIDDKARTFYYSVTCNGRWSCTASTAPGWLTCSSSGNNNGTAVISIAANGTGSSRTGVLTFKMTDYPTESCTTTIIQAAQASVTTYALELGASSKAFGVSGGSYTLTAYGVTYTDGVESSRVTLSASDIDFAKTGSSAISRSGLVFSAADLGDNNTSAQTAVYTLTWRANSSQATFTVTQAANSVAWSLVLGANTYELPAAGGTYTLSVTGKKVKNGTTTTTALTAADLTITRSGSTAVSNSGLVFSASDLTYNETTGTTSTFAIVWTAHSSATATFTATQEANTYTVIQDESSWRMPDMPDTIVWSTSGTAVAAANGDTATIDTRADEIVDERRSYTSGHVYTIQTTVHNTATFTVSGTGFSITHSYVRAAKNSTRFARFGTLTATATGMFSDMEMTWSLEQAGQS